MRFALRTVAIGTLAIAAVAPPADAQRPRTRTAGNSDWAITPELRAAVDRGLRWLARNQHESGAWIQDIGFKLNTDYRITKRDDAHVGVTALALMSFLAGGTTRDHTLMAEQNGRAVGFFASARCWC